LCWVFSPQTSYNCPRSHLLHVCNSNHTQPPINKLAILTTLGRQPLVQTGKSFTAVNGGPTKWDDWFWSSLCIGGQKWPTQCEQRCFQSWAQKQPWLFVPFRCTHPPPSILPFLFLLVKNLSPKHIVKWHHKTKVSCRMYPTTSGKFKSSP